MRKKSKPVVINKESKGYLAKLLATENISIQHKKVQTASFDVKNRVLTLPIWKNMGNDVIDLLISHEVGHALFTPEDGWRKAIDKGIQHSFLNVIEDARIEKLIKRKYPGLRQSFIKGYLELINNNFFGTKEKDVNNMLLIDRLNIHFKSSIVGSKVKFENKKELNIVKRMEDLETFEDVVKLAEELGSYCKSEMKSKGIDQLQVGDTDEDFVDDELDGQDEENHELWDWDNLEQNFSSVLLTEIDREKFDVESDAEHFKKNIIDEAMDLYSARESLLPADVMRGFERFVVLRTIDEKWKDHLYAMDQLREGINLRAYGQKNPLLEYKSEGFYMFKEMMANTTQMTLQRLFRTKIQGMDQAPQVRPSAARDVQMRHQDSTGLGFTGPPEATKNQNQPQQATRKPITTDKKIGRNEKIDLISPSGKRETVKYKKLQDYLNRGYTQA